MWEERSYFVYILASQRNGTLYTGITNSLYRRVTQHRTADDHSFTSQYQVYSLVYFEMHDTPGSAISREKRLKRWHRKWKLQLIESINPRWEDLYDVEAGIKTPPKYRE